MLPPGSSHHAGQVEGVYHDLILLLDLFEGCDHSGGLYLLMVSLHHLQVQEVDSATVSTNALFLIITSKITKAANYLEGMIR